MLWRDYSFKKQVLQKVMDRIVNRHNEKRKRETLQLWFYNNMQLDAAVREHILSSTFTYEQLETITIN